MQMANGNIHSAKKRLDDAMAEREGIERERKGGIDRQDKQLGRVTICTHTDGH